MDLYSVNAELQALKKSLEGTPSKRHESLDLNELAAALAKAQGEMDVAINSSVNPFFKSKYASFGEIVRASRPSLSKHGLAVAQKIMVDTGVLMLETKLLHASGQWIASCMPITPPKADAQSMGSYITYMKRYAYAALVGVYTDDEDDDGNNATHSSHNNTNKNAPQQTNNAKLKPNYEKVTSEQVQSIMFEIGEHTEIAENLLKNFGIQKLNELPKEYYLKIVERIKSNVNAKKEQK